LFQPKSLHTKFYIKPPCSSWRSPKWPKPQIWWNDFSTLSPNWKTNWIFSRTY